MPTPDLKQVVRALLSAGAEAGSAVLQCCGNNREQDQCDSRKQDQSKIVTMGEVGVNKFGNNNSG